MTLTAPPRLQLDLKLERLKCLWFIYLPHDPSAGHACSSDHSHADCFIISESFMIITCLNCIRLNVSMTGGVASLTDRCMVRLSQHRFNIKSRGGSSPSLPSGLAGCQKTASWPSLERWALLHRPGAGRCRLRRSLRGTETSRHCEVIREDGAEAFHAFYPPPPREGLRGRL